MELLGMIAVVYLGYRAYLYLESIKGGVEKSIREDSRKKTQRAELFAAAETGRLEHAIEARRVAIEEKAKEKWRKEGYDLDAREVIDIVRDDELSRLAEEADAARAAHGVSVSPVPEALGRTPRPGPPSLEATQAIEACDEGAVIEHPEFGRCVVVRVETEPVAGQALKFLTLYAVASGETRRAGVLALASAGARVVQAKSQSTS